MTTLLVLLGCALVLALVGFWWLVRVREMDRWIWAYLREWPRRRDPSPVEEVHVLLCIADHWEPKFGKATMETARARVRAWTEGLPRFARFRDSDGRAPRHTFFYPAEEYEPELLDEAARLCAAGFGEVEVHLHHHDDTPENMRRTLEAFRDSLAGHGLLGRDKATGEPAYCFVHGDWALCGSRPDGKQCGVEQELGLLKESGCVCDMTLPSAPSPAQIGVINRVYHAADRPGPCSHAHPVPPGTPGALMLIQGPLLLDWGRRKWGLVPRLENGCLQASQPPSMERLRLWLRARVQVPSRPEWFFVKLHAHGAPEDAHGVLLGKPMEDFHAALAAEAARNPRFHYHYVTAREMANLARAALAGYAGDVAPALDWEILPPSFTPPTPARLPLPASGRGLGGGVDSLTGAAR
ncbi:MAG: hypothetical protein K2W96_14225 [Gemmataceae bacterium]|nr:hypothetical protein [Gemmataceae bacterium]